MGKEMEFDRIMNDAQGWAKSLPKDVKGQVKELRPLFVAIEGDVGPTRCKCDYGYNAPPEQLPAFPSPGPTRRQRRMIRTAQNVTRGLHFHVNDDCLLHGDARIEVYRSRTKKMDAMYTKLGVLFGIMQSRHLTAGEKEKARLIAAIREAAR